MLKICLAFWESEPQYAYKRYAYKKCTSTSKFISCPVIWTQGLPVWVDSNHPYLSAGKWCVFKWLLISFLTF